VRRAAPECAFGTALVAVLGVISIGTSKQVFASSAIQPALLSSGLLHSLLSSRGFVLLMKVLHPPGRDATPTFLRGCIPPVSGVSEPAVLALLTRVGMCGSDP
jgi:hypothetical protein